jgi:hypothetical protein
MKFPEEWLDIHGLVLPQPNDKRPCDNGVMFLSVAVLLGYDFPDYKETIRSCYLQPGLIARWPGNDYDQAAWDDYMTLAVACIYLKDKSIPREVVAYAIGNFFVFNTDKKLETRDFLLRNFPIWPLMFVAAFPILRLPIYPLLWLVQKFFKDPFHLIQVDDTSGFQLQWLFLLGCKLLGFTFPTYQLHHLYKPVAFQRYYHKDHPFNVNK